MSTPETDLTGSLKRTYNLRSHVRRKKTRHNRALETLVASVVLVSKPEDILLNKVWMNERDVQKMEPALWDDEKPLMVQIADRVYTVIPCDWIEEKSIGLNPQQNAEVEEAVNFDGDVMVSTFIPSDQNQQILKRAVFSVSYDDEDELEFEDEREVLHVDVKQFTNYFRNHYGGQLFKEGQTILTYHNNIPITITLMKSRGFTNPSSYEIFGVIAEETDLIFKSTEFTNIKFFTSPQTGSFQFKFDVIFNHHKSEDDLEMRFRRILENRFIPLEDTISSYPFIVDADKLGDYIRKMIGDTPHCEGDLLKVPLEGGSHLNARLFEVKDQRHAASNIRAVNKRDFEYENSYRLDHRSTVEIYSGSPSLVLTKGAPKIAKYISFYVSDVNPDKSYPGWESSSKNWINSRDFVKKIQTHLKEFVHSTQFEIEFDGVCFLVEVEKIDAFERDKCDSHPTAYSPCWKFGKNTKVNIRLNPEIERVLVQNNKGFPLKSLKVSIEPSMEVAEKKELRFKSSDIEIAFREAAPKMICLNQEFIIDLGSIGCFNAFIESFNFSKTSLNNSQDNFLGTLTEGTKFEFLHRENFKVDEVEEPLDFSDPYKAMESLGLTGLPKGGKELLEDVLFSLTPEGKKIGFKKPRGVILSGPPGTGKTTFVQNLRKMLGIPKSRFTMISGTTPISKWMGQSEKNIRKLFEPAIKDPEHFYFLFIDELDGLASERSDETKNHNRIVNEFLSQMDGVHRPENLMVFATTNHKSLIDPACFRPGRFERVVDFSLPTTQECLEILELHSKPLLDQKLIASDVNLEEEADLCEGMSGAHIRGMVEEAKKNYYRRIRKNKYRKRDPRSKICREDFTKGREVVQMNRKDRANVDPVIPGEILDVAERPRDTLKRIGPVGLPEEVLDYIDSLVYSLRQGGEHAEKIGFKLPRGILIHGRPGTGKTMLAKSLVHLMGVPPYRIQILTGSDFLHRDFQSEKKHIREAICRAKSDDPDNAPLHVIILENLKHMKRENQDQFFKILQEEKGLDNLLIIATCNVVDLYDEPERYHTLQEASQPTRFQKIIEMKPPGDRQRLEIFRFLLSDLIDNEMLHEDVDMHWLVRLAGGHSGAWIKGFIDDAKSCNMSRILDGDDDEKLMRQDFMKAHARRAAGVKISEPEPPETMFY